MSAQITHLPANTTQEELLHSMAVDGAVIIDDVLGGEQLEALDNDLAPFLKKKCMAATRSPVSTRSGLAHSLRVRKPAASWRWNHACWMPQNLFGGTLRRYTTALHFCRGDCAGRVSSNTPSGSRYLGWLRTAANRAAVQHHLGADALYTRKRCHTGGGRFSSMGQKSSAGAR